MALGCRPAWIALRNLRCLAFSEYKQKASGTLHKLVSGIDCADMHIFRQHFRGEYPSEINSMKAVYVGNNLQHTWGDQNRLRNAYLSKMRIFSDSTSVLIGYQADLRLP